MRGKLLSPENSHTIEDVYVCVHLGNCLESSFKKLALATRYYSGPSPSHVGT